MSKVLYASAGVALLSAIVANMLGIVHPEGWLGWILYFIIVCFGTLWFSKNLWVSGLISAGALAIVSAYYVGVSANLVAEFILNAFIIIFVSILVFHVAGVKKASTSVRSLAR